MKTIPDSTPDPKPSATKRIMPILQRLAAPLLLVGVSLTLHFSSRTATGLLDLSGSTPEIPQKITATLTWAAFAFLLARIVDVAFWRGVMRTHGYQVPKLLQELVAAIIWLGAFCGAISLVFGYSVAAILTASTVLVGVIGFALQRPIMDAFSGVVIALQQPFKEGDWILTDDKIPGRVTEMNWRAVKLVTPDEITFVVPNSQFTSNSTKIFSQPHQFFRDEIHVTLPYSVTSHQAQRILLSAANQVHDIASIPRNSIVSVNAYTDCGVQWRLLYWCPDPGKVPVYRLKVHQNILRNLFYSGIDIPFPTLNVRPLEAKLADPDDEIGIDKMLARISLFAVMTSEELRYLSQEANHRLYLAGQPVLRQGEPGDSLFILREGLLNVKITTEDGTEIVVGKIESGQFFGEKSLLLGDPRGATVVPVTDSMVTEISKDVMGNLMRDRPAIVNYLSEILSERQLATTSRSNTSDNRDDEESHSLAKRLSKRIRTFFNLASV